MDEVDDLYDSVVSKINRILKWSISVVASRISIETWIKVINSVSFIPENLRYRLIFIPPVRENERTLDYLGLKYHATVRDSLNLLARIDFKLWEPESRRIFLNLCKDSNLVLDIGAYSGVYSLIAAKSMPSTRIIAFEPNPQIRESLVKNIEINGFADRIKVECIALSNAPGVSVLSIGEDSSMANLNSEFDQADDLNESSVLVQVMRLDDLLLPGNVDLMKVDIEGSEISFLLGAMNTIDLHKPIILMEALTDRDLRLQYDFLSKLGYQHPIRLGKMFGDERNYLWTTEKKFHL